MYRKWIREVSATGIGCLHKAGPRGSRKVGVCSLLSLKDPYLLVCADCAILPVRVVLYIEAGLLICSVAALATVVVFMGAYPVNEVKKPLEAVVVSSSRLYQDMS